LRVALKTYFASQNPTLVLGILRDKDCQTICEILAPLAGRILLVPVNSQRSASSGELAVACRTANPKVEIAEVDSLKKALALAGSDAFVVIAGSLYLIGEGMELLKLSASKAADERGLNEWSAVRPASPSLTK
jgi:dihydrofolate synthase/folylpolyglutamate synthase